MIKEIINRWEANKQNLEEYLRNAPQSYYDTYERLVEVLIRECLNCNLEKGCSRFSANFDVIDHGDYQGTQIFVLHKDVYQPGTTDYYAFDNDYGSCSNCDALLAIQLDYGESCSGLPSEKQVCGYMSLLLHMVQRMKCLDDLFEEEHP